MVKTGLETFLTESKYRRGIKRVALLVNYTAVDKNLHHAIPLIKSLPDIQLVKIFSPEHGLWGTAQDMISVDHTTDPLSGCPVYSLYGNAESTLAPTAEQLEDIDAVICDIQDVGSRYYTYAASIVFTMEVCAKLGLPCLVLDRPNPLNGNDIEGNLIDDGFYSFVGTINVPQRHGLTMGELCNYYRQIKNIKSDLRIVPMADYNRSLWFDQCNLPWVYPSPNMPTLEAAIVYPGGCLFEATDCSEGRGTTKPFELFGAPYINAFKLTKVLNDMELPGVFFRAHHFMPTYQKQALAICGGVEIHVTNRNIFQSLKASLAVIYQTHRLWPKDFTWRTKVYEFRQDVPAMDLLCGNNRVRTLIDAGAPFADVYDAITLPMEKLRELHDAARLYT